ncbi:hypothetical protein LAZ67_19002518 [Cordylochernes scorpioides]|uniref:Uncharacterized protein n=1 Tax=Cordylochernes scorpioides TaxID=51811 RepID=A0ABY6LIK0_9ARAC|nr:hypothetical protein LAZ67_19002518 [Cordylochernes scorpioides]
MHMGKPQAHETKATLLQVQNPMDIFKETTWYRSSPLTRKYVSLPWTVEKAKIADNREIAMKRLEQTTKKLIYLNLHEDYDDIIRDWLADGIIEKVPAEQDDAEAFYLPHRPVVKLSNLVILDIGDMFLASAMQLIYPPEDETSTN